MKRILCILNSLDIGGAETFLMKVYRRISTDDFQFDFIVSSKDGYYTDEVLEYGGYIYNIPMRTQNPIGALNGIRKIVKNNSYEYVLKLGDKSISVLDLIAAKAGGAKCLAMRSCNALTGLSKRDKFFHSLFCPILNVVANVKLAPSTLAAEFTFGKKNAHRDVKLLHNGLDLNVFYYDRNAGLRVREEFNLHGNLIVGHIGRFHEQKNHQYLLEIFKKIREQRNDAVLLLVGDGKLEKTVKNRTKELGIDDSVIFTGQRNDIPQLLSAMDVFVFPSLYEGMPNTVIEAQATGLPCVIADTITPEVNITGLVSFVPLTASKAYWAQKALDSAIMTRNNTEAEFIEHGYDIEHVTEKFIEYLGI